MAWQRIRFQGGLNEQVEPLSMDEGFPILIDGFVDEAGSLQRRPGLAAWRSVPTLANGVEPRGLYFWPKRQILVLVAGKRVYSCTQTGTWTDVTGTELEGDNRPVFCDDGTLLFIASGSAILVWGGPGTTTHAVTHADAPTAVTHVAFIDGYILANSAGSKEWAYADPSSVDPTQDPEWSAYWLTAEVNPDDLVALHVGWREVYLLGRNSIEIWTNTQVTTPTASNPPFELAQYLEIGILAPYSYVMVGNSPIWLSPERMVMALEGRTPTPMGREIARTLASFEVVEDAFAMLVQVGGRRWYVISFPSANRTFALDLSTNKWAEWAFWVPQDRRYERFLGNAAVQIPEWGVSLVADRRPSLTPSVRAMSLGFYDDAGDPIRFCWRSNVMDWGNGQPKRSRMTTFTLRRGARDVVSSDGRVSVPLPPEV